MAQNYCSAAVGNDLSLGVRLISGIWLPRTRHRGVNGSIAHGKGCLITVRYHAAHARIARHKNDPDLPGFLIPPAFSSWPRVSNEKGKYADSWCQPASQRFPSLPVPLHNMQFLRPFFYFLAWSLVRACPVTIHTIPTSFTFVPSSPPTTAVMLILSI